MTVRGFRVTGRRAGGGADAARCRPVAGIMADVAPAMLPRNAAMPPGGASRRGAARQAQIERVILSGHTAFKACMRLLQMLSAKREALFADSTAGRPGRNEYVCSRIFEWSPYIL